MFKFLDSSGCTWYDGQPFAYNLPRRGEKWALTEHPDPGMPDGEACGPGGLHAMRSLSARYAPSHWWPWYCREAGTRLGEDAEKVRNTALELRRMTKQAFWRSLRPPFNWGNKADLRQVDLRGAILRGAILREANLRGAYLRRADLRWASLYGTDLHGADLYRADLREADLRQVDLRGADLCEADLRGANLHGAGLRGANLREANLSGAYLRRADLREANLRGADMRGADMREADLREATVTDEQLAQAAWLEGVTMPNGAVWRRR